MSNFEADTLKQLKRKSIPVGEADSIQRKTLDKLKTDGFVLLVGEEYYLSAKGEQYDQIKCKCGHPLSWHAHGQNRPFWMCESSGCECENFDEITRPVCRRCRNKDISTSMLTPQGDGTWQCRWCTLDLYLTTKW